MSRLRAVLGSLVFLVVAPGVAAGLVPWALTGWEARATWPALQVAGIALVVAGVTVLLHAFARFALEGLGTPAPVAPPERLVVGGLYRFVRNPMYLAVAATIGGQALIMGRPGLLAYAAVFSAAVAAFVRFYEEPTLAARYGRQYADYRRAVPAWWPRRRPWDASAVEPLAPVSRPEPGALGHAQQHDGGHHGDDEADDVELPDVARTDQVGDGAPDDRPQDAEHERPQQADLLPSGEQQAGEQADDEAGDDESDHAG
jgi:protein-S-isoprenylcysteine O-methyltransferase Ste14